MMLILLFLLLLVPSAWAELKPLPDPPMVYDSERHIWRGGHGYAPRIEEPPQTPVSYDRMKDCLDKMEEAMRAMEPYLPGREHMKPSMSFDALYMNTHLYSVMVEQVWNDAKACWGKP